MKEQYLPKDEKGHSQPKWMTVLVVEPRKEPYTTEIAPGLRSLQAAVEGRIEPVYLYDDPVALICNEEGKINMLPLNRILRNKNGEMYDFVAGTFLVVGVGEESFTSLTPEQLHKYKNIFKTAEAIIDLSAEIRCIPFGKHNAPGNEPPELDQDNDMEL